jgi:hypothetical protein
MKKLKIVKICLYLFLFNASSLFCNQVGDREQEFSLTKYYSIPGIVFPVRPAVDEVSLAYRTGQPDPVLEEVPKRITRLVFSNPEEGVPQLALFLRDDGGKKGPAANQYHLVKRIHDWITANLTYDTRKYSGTQDPLGFLTLADGPVCVCRGFADLFLWMADVAGLEAKRISGVCRTYWSSVGRYGRHAWNAVKINGSWYIVDGSGDSIHRLGVKDSGYKDSCLFASPEDNLIYYRADDEINQLVAEPVGYESWMNMPLINRSFLKYGISFLSDNVEDRSIFKKKEGHRENYYDLYKSTEEIWKMDFLVQNGFEVSVSFLDENKKKISGRSMVKYHKQSNGTYINSILVSPPGAGLYILKIYAKDYINNRASIVYTFYLEHSGGQGTILPKPGVFTPNLKFEKYSFEAGELRKVGNRYAFDIKSNPEDMIVISVKTLDGKAVRNRIKFFQTGKNTRTYFFSPPSSGIWAIWVYNKVKGSDDSLDRVGLYHVEADQAEIVGFPFYQPNYMPLFFDREVKIVQDFSLVENSDRIYSVTLEMPEDYEVRNYLLECDNDFSFLRDKDDKLIFAKGHYSNKREGQYVTFYFSPGSARSPDHVYRARIYLRENGYNKVILEYFIPAGNSPGTAVPD